MGACICRKGDRVDGGLVFREDSFGSSVKQPPHAHSAVVRGRHDVTVIGRDLELRDLGGVATQSVLQQTRRHRPYLHVEVVGASDEATSRAVEAAAVDGGAVPSDARQQTHAAREAAGAAACEAAAAAAGLR